MRQLTYLVALDRHRHFARAAESCHVSQPALSAGLSELERELGITIVKRNRSFQGITPEGERVLAWAHQVLASLEGLRQEAQLGRSVPGGHLAIGTIPSAVQAATALAAEYRRLIPGLTLEIYSLSTRDILRRLKKHDLHLGITYGDAAAANGDCEVLPLFAERYVLVAGEGAELPRNMSWSEVAKLPLCLFDEEMHNRSILDHIFREAGVQPNIVMETNAVEVLHSEVQGGQAVSVMPISALPRYFLEIGVKVHPIHPEQSSKVGLLRLNREAQPPLSNAAWNIAKAFDLQGLLDELVGEAR